MASRGSAGASAFHVALLLGSGACAFAKRDAPTLDDGVSMMQITRHLSHEPLQVHSECKDDDAGVAKAAASTGHATIKSCEDAALFCQHHTHGAEVRKFCCATCNAAPARQPTQETSLRDGSSSLEDALLSRRHSAGCENTNGDATSSGDKTCAGKTQDYYTCVAWDDSDFTAREMCCICFGGTTPAEQEYVYEAGPRVSNEVLLCESSIFTLEDAQARCSFYPTCEAIHDADCDGILWSFCYVNTSVMQSTSGGNTSACTMARVPVVTTPPLTPPPTPSTTPPPKLPPASAAPSSAPTPSTTPPPKLPPTSAAPSSAPTPSTTPPPKLPPASAAPSSAPTPSTTPPRKPGSTFSSAPTPAPTPQVASATGDPHVTNVDGARFDIMKTGVHELLRLPRRRNQSRGAAGPEPPPLLSVSAAVERTDEDDCRESYVRQVDVMGSWLNSSGPLRFRAVGDSPDGTHAIRLFVNGSLVGGAEELRRRSSVQPFLDVVEPRTAPANHVPGAIHKVPMLTVKLGFSGATLQIDWMHRAVPGGPSLNHLNFHAVGLRRLLDGTAMDIGGILGRDDHGEAASLADGCKAAGADLRVASRASGHEGGLQVITATL